VAERRTRSLSRAPQPAHGLAAALPLAASTPQPLTHTLSGAREPYGDRDGPRRGGGFDDEDGRPPREDAGPSRADEDRDWGASKKFVPTGPSERRGERPSERDGGGGFGDGPSRADGDRNWGASKSFVPSTDGPRGDDRGGSRFGGGSFGGERRGESDGDRWARPGAAEGAGPTERPRLQLKQRSGDAPLASASGEAKASVFGGATPVQVKQLDDEPRAAPTPGRPAAPADSDRWERRGPASASAGSESASRPTERPKLQLAPRAAGAPTAATDAASLAETRGGVFGDAKPRELKLAQEGRDWRVEDALLSASGVKRDDTPEEAELRAKLAEAVAAAAAPEASAEAKAKANELELSLAKLTLSIDDKRRFAGAGGGKLAEDKGWRKAPPAEAAPK